jgi:transposase InsO family protein
MMRSKELVSCWRRKKRKVITTHFNHNQPVASSRLDEHYTALAANQKWVGDITGVWTEQGWLNLAALVFLYSCKVVGRAMSESRYERIKQVQGQTIPTAKKRVCPQVPGEKVLSFPILRGLHHRYERVA